MPTISVENLAPEVKKRIMRRLQDARIDRVLVSQAQRRIVNRGDSEHTYPDLWVDRAGLESYRSGGSPLQDTGALMGSLDSRMEETGDDTLTMTLSSPLPQAAYHQHGFTTKGPNFIPLSRAAARFRKTADAIAAGLRKGVDFIIARNGVTVPQRKLFNAPPEDVQEIKSLIKRTLTKG